LVVYSNSGPDPYTNLQQDLNLNETEYGILSGTTYTVITALSGIFMGFAADKWN